MDVKVDIEEKTFSQSLPKKRGLNREQGEFQGKYYRITFRHLTVAKYL